MKRMSIYCAAAIAAALALGAMAGCGGQPASQASTSSGSASAAASASAVSSETASVASSEAASASASAAAEKSQDEIIAELKELLSNVPAYKSVTVTEKRWSWLNEGAETEEGDGDLIESQTVYKFDESGDMPKTCAQYEIEDIKMQYYTDGDDAVCVTDGPVYSGTVEQFDLSHAAGAGAYLESAIGDLNSIVDCAVSVTQDEVQGVNGFELILDPAKYIESDEMLKLMAESGDPVREAFVTVGFDNDGRIVWMTKTDVFSEITSSTLLDLADFDSTAIDPMPEATATYEEMEADMQAKIDALDAELDQVGELEGEEASAEAAEAAEAK